MASIIQRGNSWRAMIRIRGQALSRTFDTEALARRWVEREEARIKSGATAAQIVGTPSSLTVAALFERYAREVSPEKRGSRWEIIRLRALAQDAAFAGEAAALDGAAMAEWRDGRLRSVSAATVNRELNLISAVLTRSIKEWRLPLAANPVHNIQRPKQPAERVRRVSDEERAAIVKELGWSGTTPPVDTREWIAWGFCLALETMMRQGEILALRWRHVHPRHCHLPMTKNGHPRDVPLSSAARALFALVTPGIPEQRVVPVTVGTFGAYFRDAVRGADIEDLHFHDTRREALTRTARKLTEIELARASGHSSTRALMRYYRPAVEDLADKLG
jgi:integrase